MTTISYVLATGLSMIVITWCTMFVVMSYARASIRDAALRGSRAGVVEYTNTNNANAAIHACELSFKQSLNSGLPSHVTYDISNNCMIVDNRVRVHTTGSLRSITPAIPNFSIDETTYRTLEPLP